MTSVKAVALLLMGLLMPAFPGEAAPPPDELESNDGYRGIWLRSDRAEAFVALEPEFRVLSFRRPGDASLLAGSAAPQAGLRLAVMEPNQTADSFAPGQQPAKLLEHESHRAVVELAPAETGLQYRVGITLAGDRPRLDLRYRLTNLADHEREVACWSLLSFTRDGRIVIPFGAEPGALRRLVLPRWSSWPQPSVTFGRDAIGADAGARLQGHTYKVGITTEAGWAGFVRDGTVLVTLAPYQSGAVYPEGGANVTAFVFDRADQAWCELEQVGPLTRLEPGDHAVFSESLYLLDAPDEGRDPDAARLWIGEALARQGVPGLPAADAD